MKKNKIPSMTPTVVHDYLREVGGAWTGQGVAMELGSWLGASAVPLLEGLVKAGYDRPFYCYDTWRANKEQVGKAACVDVKIKNEQDLLPLFLRNVMPTYSNLIPSQNRIENVIKKYKGGPIEICIFDAPKQDPIFNMAMRGVMPHFIPGVTILGLLDYYFYLDKPEKKKRLMAPVRFMETNAGYFTKLMEWPVTQCSCVFFRYEKKLNLPL